MSFRLFNMEGVHPLISSGSNPNSDRNLYIPFSIVQTVSTPINPLVYGVNFPTSASYIQHLGVTVSRWGGNAVTAYNPFDGFTNAGNDWYFENRVSDQGSADDWVGWVHGAGSGSMVTIPA